MDARPSQKKIHLIHDEIAQSQFLQPVALIENHVDLLRINAQIIQLRRDEMSLLRRVSVLEISRIGSDSRIDSFPDLFIRLNSHVQQQLIDDLRRSGSSRIDEDLRHFTPGNMVIDTDRLFPA